MQREQQETKGLVTDKGGTNPERESAIQIGLTSKWLARIIDGAVGTPVDKVQGLEDQLSVYVEISQTQ